LKEIAFVDELGQSVAKRYGTKMAISIKKVVDALIILW